MEASQIQSALTSFPNILELISRYSLEEIISCVSELTNISVRELANRPMGGYSKGKTSGAYYFVLKDMKNNLSHYRWFYERLTDEISRDVFTNLMRFRLFPDIKFVSQAYDAKHPQYFDLNIVNTNENEIFVDCGGFTGDTVLSYMENCGAYKRIYVYEPSSENIIKCRENLATFSNIEIRQAGIASASGVSSLSNACASSSLVMGGLSDISESEQVDIVSLDEDIKESVTFIKMDIECFEIDGIYGAARHIRDDTPKLAICLYHIVSDIWEIPRLIHAINPKYRYYIRHYMQTQNWETVLYAIPLEGKTE
jgi:FkbM family methyltransferase